MSTPPTSPERFTVVDWIGIALAAGSGVGLLGFPLVGRTFARMFEDLGSTSLPVLTRLATSVWFPLVLAAVVAGLLGFGLRTKRRALIAVAFMIGIAAITMCIVGVYLPIFSIAGNIKAD